MRLAELAAQIPDAQLHGDGSVEVRSITCDSRTVAPGALFGALPGTRADGATYVPEALARGAVGVLAGRPLSCDQAPLIVSPQPRKAFATAAERLYGSPSQRLALAGVTGTNGKTTTAYLLRHLLTASGERCGLLGTIMYDTGRESRPAPMTTPDSATFARLLAEMVDGGCSAAVAEVSSHALDQDRVCGAQYAAAVFTNLTRDHLDYHMDMERYAAAKMRLFELLEPGACAVLNADDPYAARMAGATRGRPAWYGLDALADLTARIRELTLEGSVFTVSYAGRAREVQTRLVGRHNVRNALAAALAAVRLGTDLDDVMQGLESFAGVPGRLERVRGPGGPAVFVDYAHTDDALRHVLAALRPLCRGRLILVFGCGGDRDRGKRPLMARTAEAGADRVVVTHDNPRTESRDRIFADVRGGFQRPEAVLWQPDRARAVAEAVALAEPADTVLVAGKGHETYQMVGTQRFPLDDREVARKALVQQFGSGEASQEACACA